VIDERVTALHAEGRFRCAPVRITAAPLIWPAQPAYLPAMANTSAGGNAVLDARAMERTLTRIADEIVELNDGTDGLVVVGIQRRGVQLAERIVAHIEAREGVRVPQGSLDITLYRDDLQTVGPRPVVGATHLPWEIDGKHVVIVDDVLYTGRTVRAALDELADFGRPARIALAVLVDRGGRELPIEPACAVAEVELNSHQRLSLARDDAGRFSFVMR
jgi:pyrimidine operon attenuation protein/uracil phosphoribosyltransferase